MEREPEERKNAKEQRRAELEERRAQQRREDDEREVLPYTIVVWLLKVFKFSNPLTHLIHPNGVWVSFGLAVLMTVVAAVHDFKKTGFTEKSWMTFIIDAILMVISIVIMID